MNNFELFSILQGYEVEEVSLSGCWEYQGKQKGRYPRVSYEGQKFQLHRLSWVLMNGMISDGIYVCHKCDNTKCCNPDHLFLGTQFDNMQDMVKKGRNFDTSGENNGRANLTWDLVKQIREDFRQGMQNKILTKKYNLPVNSISAIVRNKTWRDKTYEVPKTIPLNRSITEEVYKKVKELNAGGISQTEIGRMVGISQTGVWRILSGRSVVWGNK